MHGTFRGRIEEGAGMTVRFDMRASHLSLSRRRRAKLAALLASCCVAVLPSASAVAPSQPLDRQPPRPHEPATASALVAEAYPIRRIILRAPLARVRQGSRSVASQSPPPPRAMSPSATVSPIEPAAPADIPRFALAPSPSPPLMMDLPGPVAELAIAEPLRAPLPADLSGEPQPPLRPVDVAQIADSEVRSLHVPQLHQPGLAVGGEPELSARIAAMQVTPLPAPRLRDSDRAVLLAEAPTRLTLRIGSSALGKVDFRMTATRTIDVKLSGLLDLLAGHYDTAEFARLRGSAAADAYVSFDQLRAVGLNVRYDPAYDELRING